MAKELHTSAYLIIQHSNYDACKLIYILWFLCISCNMGRRDLPDMYALSPRAADPRAEGIHIGQIPTE